MLEKITLCEIKKMIASGEISKSNPVQILRLSQNSYNHSLGSLIQINQKQYLCSYNMIVGARSVFAKGLGDYFTKDLFSVRRLTVKSISTLDSKEIFLDKLFEKHAPKYACEFKKEVYDLAFAKFGNRKQRENPLIHVAKHQSKNLKKIELAENYTQTQIAAVDTFFDYCDVSDDKQKVWYLNFADKYLFGFYETDLFAQDEIQALEHPALPAVREWLDAKEYKNLNAETLIKNEPTPITIENVPRWIYANTKDYPVYGYYFGEACDAENFELLRKAVRVLDEEHINNIIAMRAPAGGEGRYQQHQIEEALKSAIAGFGGAVGRNCDVNNNKVKTVIHTGRWGAGAFGNNEELMLTVQILAAKITGVDKLVFHAVNPKCLTAALQVVAEIEKAEKSTAQQISGFLYAKNYFWGTSNGT